MTTAARPTFHPAVGGEDQGYFRMEGGTRQVSARDLPGHTRLKMRRQGQGTKNENATRDLKAELQERELKALAASARGGSTASGSMASSEVGDRGPPPALMESDGKDADDIVAADVDDDDSDDDDEDETAELMRELERIKKEREEDAARKAVAEKAREEQEKQDQLLRGNPLLAGGGAGSFGVKRRWDDDVVFRNQARTEPETKKRFINDTIRNDFHKKFLSKYVK